jgi:oligopeptide transport system substrate-binding protein
MIRERRHPSEREFIFKHQLTQEAAYIGLLKRDRRLFHRQVAEAMEALYPDRIEEQVGLLAYHWEQAEEPSKATEYLLRAGDQARLVYAHQEAIDAYQRALTFLLQEEQAYERTARTLMKLGLTYHAAFDFRQARQAYDEGFTLWQRAGQEQTRELPPAPHSLRMSRTAPPTLDPTMAGDNASVVIISQLFSGLAEQTPEKEVVPDVAQDWEVLDNGTRYIFSLRRDVSWSDGTPVTAADFEYAWKRTLDPAVGSPAASLLYDVKGASAFHRGEGKREGVGIRALDDATLVVELEEPTAYFPHLLTFTSTYPVPRHIVSTCGEAWTDLDKIVSNGPFLLDDWRANETGVLLRNPDYHGRSSGNLHQVELFFTQDVDTVFELYQTDRLDILWSLWSLPVEEWNRILQRYPDDYVSLPELATHHLRFNSSHFPFDDPRVRRAFVLATDRETLADVVTGGHVFPATGGFVPPGLPGHSPGIALPYEPNLARQLLAQAGYPDGRGLPTLELLAPRGREAWCEYLKTQWRKTLGVEIDWEIIPLWSDFVQRIWTAPPPMLINGWVADYPDPDNFLRVWIQQHDHINWPNEAYDRLVEQARRVMDQEKRMQLYREADRILVEEAPIMPLIYRRWHMMVKPWVKKIPTWIVQWKDIVVEI